MGDQKGSRHVMCLHLRDLRARAHTHTHTHRRTHFMEKQNKTHVHGQSHMPDIPQDRSHENMSHSNYSPPIRGRLLARISRTCARARVTALTLPRDSADL